MPNRIYSFMGLAAKAGKLLSGEETCERAVKNGKALMVVVAEDASANTKKKFEDICRYNGVKLFAYGEKELIGRYIGKDLRAVVAIADKGFAGRLAEMLLGCEYGSGGELVVKS